MNAFKELSLVFAYVAIIMGTVVILRNSRDPVHRLFFLFCAGAFYWCFVEYGMRHAGGMAEAQVWMKVFSFWPLPEVFMLHFALLYSGIMKPGWRFVPLFLLYAPALAFSLIDVFTTRISGVPVLVPWGWTYGMPLTVEKTASVIWACAITTASVGVSIWSICATSITRRRKQGLFILCGFISLVVAGYSTDVASFLFNLRIPEMTSLGFSLGTVFIGYAIFKYNLFNLAPAAAAQEIIDAINDILLLVDENGMIVSSNRAATTLLGYDADELAGKPLEFTVACEDRDSAKSLLAGRNSDPGDNHLEINLLTKQARPVLFSASTSVVRDRLGIYQGTIFVGHDISGYKLIQEKLFLARQEAERTKVLRRANSATLNLLEDLKTENMLREASEDKFSKAFKTSPYAITITRSEDGVFIDVNDAFTLIAGYTREETLTDSSIGLKLWVDEEDRQRVVNDLRAGKVVNGHEYQFRTKSGRNITGLFSAQIIKLISGPCILSSINDITERKQAGKAIIRLNAELEERVLGRTIQLEEANKELESFAYSVSHDLRAPLRAIDGFSEILVDDHSGSLDAEAKRLCLVIRENTRRMDQLIEDLLAFSRMGRFTMQAGLINMKALAESVFTELTDGKTRSRIDFRMNELAPAWGDFSMIRQVWVNLLSNAIKFSSKVKRAVITVCAVEHEDEIVYSVADNGAGFDMRYQDKLFNVFQRLHAARDFEGTGVGLAIVKRVISRHDGRVWAEGNPDQGATFHFSLIKGEREKS